MNKQPFKVSVLLNCTNVFDEEFQCVGRTIFIRSKVFFFSHLSIILTQIFKILTSFPSHNPF